MSEARVYQEATGQTPHVDFNFPERYLVLTGESYPEDAASFYGPLLRAVSTFLEHATQAPLRLDVQLSYFNSSTAKALMTLFDMLEGAAESGTAVEVNWYYDPDDDTMQEFGEDFSEDMAHVAFRLCPLEDA